MVDVLIAGGGVAGSTLAILLGRRGFPIELFERAIFLEKNRAAKD